MKKKVLTLVMTLAMLASLVTVPAAAAGGKTFPDAVGHWAEDSILRWSRSGLVKGDEFGNVNPNTPLRRCEMATIISDMLGLRTAAPISTFRDIDGSEWYARAILRCAAAGIMEGNNGMSYPQDYITREEAIKMVSVALRVQGNEDPDLDKFTDGDSVSGWAAPYMATLTELGILDGMGDGRIAPHENINRAGAFALMDKAISVYANAPGTYNSKNANGFVVINANAYEGGDVVVTGRANGVLVSVGATNTVRFRDLDAENVIINGKGDVVVTGKSDLDTVAVDTGVAVSVEADAKVDTLNVNVEKVSVTNAGTVKALNCPVNTTVKNSGEVTKLVAGAKISLTNTGTVDNLVANAGLTVDNTKGTVKNAEINVGGVVMDGPPQQMTLGSGVARPTTSSGRPVSATGTIPAAGGGGNSPSPSKPSVTGVTLNYTSWSLKAEDPEQNTLKLTATVTPSGATQTVKWSSDKTDVATVDNEGVVTAVAAGKATITVTTTSGGKTAQCVIDVRAADDDSPVAVSSVSLNETKLELEVNKTFQLTATVTPENAADKSVTWESSDSETVSVNGGLVTALKASSESVTITATAGEKTATCEVTVREAASEEKPVTGLTLTPSELNLKMGETITGTVTAVVVPADATNAQVTWTVTEGKDVIDISDTDTNTITVTAKTDGSATITAEAGGQVKTCQVTVDPAGSDTPRIVIAPVDTLIVDDAEKGSATLSVTVNGGAPTEEMIVNWNIMGEGTAVKLEGNVVTAQQEGTATIQVTVTIGGETYTKTIEIEVEEAGAPPQQDPVVTKVELDKSSTEDNPIQLVVSDDRNKSSITITATITMSDGSPATKPVEWTVNKEGIVELREEGNAVTVTAQSAGTVTIIATAGEGENQHTASVTIEVSLPPEEGKPTPTIDIAFDDFDQSTIAKDDPFDLAQYLKVEVSPAEITYTTTWKIEDEEADATVTDDGKVTFTAAGTVTVKVTVTIEVADGEPITKSQTVTLTLSATETETETPSGDE